MAYDGFTTAAVCAELHKTLTGGYLSKIVQPEKDALLLTVKTASGQKLLYLSASSSLPLVYLTETNRKAPLQAPVFCMLLRKYIGGGKIVSVSQPSLERVMILTIERRNELGDPGRWQLIAEIMGKHSNLILTDGEGRITDSIKRIPSSVSSVREVLPGRQWFIPNTAGKQDPYHLSQEEFRSLVFNRSQPVYKAVYQSLTGFSPVMAEELCFRARVDGGIAASSVPEGEAARMSRVFSALMDEVREQRFTPVMIQRGKTPVDFSALTLTQYTDLENIPFLSISSLIETYYAEKEQDSRIRQRSAGLRHLVQMLTDRDVRTLSLQEKQMQDTEKKDKYRLYGELILAYGYEIRPGMREAVVEDYYTNEKVTIPLDPLQDAGQNARRYYDRYNKLKRTAQALEGRILSLKEEIRYLESVSASLDTAADEKDLIQIRQELADHGFIRDRKESGRQKRGAAGQTAGKAAPLHYVSADGFDIYVGKNNYQNEEVSFRIGGPDDWWFHAKNIPGSHVVLKTDNREVPDRAFEEAARLAAYYSGGKLAPKVEIDYTLRRNLKKPSGAKPGFVVYYTNYSMMAEPDISGLKRLPS